MIEQVAILQLEPNKTRTGHCAPSQQKQAAKAMTRTRGWFWTNYRCSRWIGYRGGARCSFLSDRGYPMLHILAVIRHPQWEDEPRADTSVSALMAEFDRRLPPILKDHPMRDKDTNDPAPTEDERDTIDADECLRDEFAADAMRSLIDEESLWSSYDDDERSPAERIAARAYEIASAMMRERAKRKRG